MLLFLEQWQELFFNFLAAFLISLFCQHLISQQLTINKPMHKFILPALVITVITISSLLAQASSGGDGSYLNVSQYDPVYQSVAARDGDKVALVTWVPNSTLLTSSTPSITLQKTYSLTVNMENPSLCTMLRKAGTRDARVPLSGTISYSAHYTPNNPRPILGPATTSDIGFDSQNPVSFVFQAQQAGTVTLIFKVNSWGQPASVTQWSFCDITVTVVD